MLLFTVRWRCLIPVGPFPSPFSCSSLAPSTVACTNDFALFAFSPAFANDHLPRQSCCEFQSFRDLITPTLTMVSHSAVGTGQPVLACPLFSRPRVALPCLASTGLEGHPSRKIHTTHEADPDSPQADSLTEEQVSEFKEAFSLFVSSLQHTTTQVSAAWLIRRVYTG